MIFTRALLFPDAFDSRYAPLYFYSGVLPSGNVVVVGGEYNGASGSVWTNAGFLYNPVADTWSALTVPWGNGRLGDAQGVILDDGTLLLACGACPAGDFRMASFDESTLTFTSFTPTGKADQHNEENWNILPNGTVLTVDTRIASQ